MTADAAKVAALMAERDMPDWQVARRMRRTGLPGTTAHWVSMVRRGIWGDMPLSWIAGLAAALGVEADQILGRPRLHVVGEQQ